MAERGAQTAVFLPGPAHSLHRNPDYRRQRLAYGVSVVGPVGTYLVLTVLAYQLTGSSLWAASTAAIGFLPHLAGAVLPRPAGGHLDRRRLLAITDIANAALLGSVPIAFSVDALTAPHVLVAAFVGQALFVLFDAANAGAPPVRVRSVSGSTALRLAAPILAGGLLTLTAVRPLLTVDGVSIIVSVLLIRAIAPPPQAVGVPRPRHAARESLKVRVQTIVWALHGAAGGVFAGLFAPWFDQDLGVPSVRDIRLGLLIVVCAVSGRIAMEVQPLAAERLVAPGTMPRATADRLATAGILSPRIADRLSSAGVLARLGSRLGRYRVTLFFLPLAALCALACVLAPHWLVAVLTLAAFGTAYTVVVLDLRQQSGSGWRLAFGGSWPLGALLGGVVATATNPRLGLALAAVLIAAAAAVAWLSPLRTISR
jgi:hypothetical protein